MIIGCSGSGKTNSLFNLINQQLYIDKIYLCAKDPYEARFLTDKRESTGIKHFNDSKAFFEYSNNMVVFNKILTIIIQIKNKKYWSFLMIWLLLCLLIKKLYVIVTELFITGKKNFVVFITQSYFAVPKDIRLKSMDYFIMKTRKTQKLKHIASHNSSDIDFKYFMKLYQKCT